MESLVAPSINLLILIGFLAYKLKLPLREFVAQRHQTIREDVRTVRLQLREAQEKYDEFTAKLKSVDSEIAALKEQVKQDAAQMKQRVLADASRGATTVVADAKSAAQGLYTQLREELYIELGTQVLARTETLLRERLTGEDRARIRQEFSRQLESIQEVETVLQPESVQ